ncbi:hypothetical protein DUNSADRAFT_7015 [Dunaliella salina]|uniref:Uncharacterized protein n=1 Tax=Dunaliella salina TaxID=3046 RepID=A0ABQ7GM75_DUNSA|nr:hypothetical protein DUNSADRAFT_7015 [Dunaliella salina]|eukprot:KAF5835687.1 hypothetical protein DUNSADRAFT_7015 [Dunaliella salina]
MHFSSWPCRCRHCPYGHLRIKPTPRTPRINRITRPTLLPWCDHPVPLSAYSTDVVLLVVLAGQSVSSVAASLDQLRQAGKGGDGDAHGGCSSCIGIPGQRHIVAVVAVDPSSRSCWQASPPASANTTVVGAEPHTSNSACKSSSHSSPAAASHTASHEYADGLSSVMDCCAQLGLPIVAVPVHNQHQHGNPQADSAGVVLSTAECGHVLRQAAEVVACAQRRHLEQHKDLMAEVGASCSRSQQPNPDLHDAHPKDAATRRTDRALAEGQNCGARIPGGVWGPLAGLACVQQDGRETSGTSAWPELPWRASLDAQSKGRDGCVAPSPHELWSRVAAEMQLPYL